MNELLFNCTVLDLFLQLPGLILIVGPLLLPFLPKAGRLAGMVALPVLSGLHLAWLVSRGTTEPVRRTLFEGMGFGGMEIVPVRLDELAMVWGIIFHIAAFLAAIYSLHTVERRELRGKQWEHTAGLIYAGAAIGAVFAGDLLTLFVYWELTAIASVFLIWGRDEPGIDRPPAVLYRTGMRYLVIQVGSGVILLAGLLLRQSDGDVEGNPLYFGHLFKGDIFAAPLWAQLIFLAFGIKAAFPLLHSWLQDAYSRGTHTGTVFLSAFTTKMAIYALARGFAGTETLIYIGVIMTLFPIPFAVLENDLRKTLAFSLNNQLGFMCVGVGVGTTLALNGTALHAFAHILYKSLLFMSMGAVLYRAKTCKVTELGGLYKSMRWTAIFCIVGAMSIAGFPLLNGFISKSLTISAVAKEHLFWIYMGLMLASAGVMEHSGIKIPFYGFFSKDKGLRVEPAPLNMRLAMGLTAALCLFMGLTPSLFYKYLAPYPVKYDAYTWAHVVDQLLLLGFAGLAFLVLYRRGIFPKYERSLSLDVDIVYRKLLPWAARHAGRAEHGGRRALVGVGSGAVRGVVDVFYRWVGPRGMYGRSWTSGNIAGWATVMLAFYLLFVFMWR